MLRLCREGRLFELQAWVASGKPLSVPAYYRQTPLHVALETGFHSLIEFLLQNQEVQSGKDDLLEQATWRGNVSIMQLALRHGASVGSVPFQHVIETWNRGIAQLFLEHGADPVTNAPFARAFLARVKAGLGIYLDCKRARPDLADALQFQADMALRQACQDGDLKWVSLLMWLGANPRTKGLVTEDLDTPDGADDPDYRQSALEIACRQRNPDILKRLKPDPAVDDLQVLASAVSPYGSSPETVAYLVKLGANVNDKSDGGSTLLEGALRNFAWKEAYSERPYETWRNSVVPLSRLGKALDALHFLLDHGARWTPGDRAMAETRRAMYQVDADGVSAVIELLRTHQACPEPVLKELVRTPKMKMLLADVVRRKAADERAGHRAVKRVHRQGAPRPKPSMPTMPAPSVSRPAAFPPSPYDRQRLYEEVWSEPTRKVAERYGVSDVAIGKACAQLAIPKPPRGYWAKKAAGQEVPGRPPLPTERP